MTKEEIIIELQKKYKAFADELEVMNEKEFSQKIPGKWNAAQHADHLNRSLLPLVIGLKMPKFIPKVLFGKANRASKSYQELVAKYLTKIAEGAKAVHPFIPSKFHYHSKQSLVQKLLTNVDKLCKIIDGFVESKLDEMVFPHPFLEKVTLREMLYFTIYHAEHHRKLLLKNLED